MGEEPTPKSEAARREEEILAFWKENRIFEKTLEKDAPQGEFIFYDGPPFATGLPHYGSLLSSAVKDIVGRYKTMRGFYVPRRWGWDCHGLPIETLVEKKLGLKEKKEIEQLGIARFNEEARASVLTYVSEWKAYIERIGRWVDFDNSYKTMDNSYIEGVWGVLKKVHEDGRLYEGKKVLMYCPHDETPLAKAEIAMDNSYKEVTDEAVFVKFKLKDNTAVHNRFGVSADGKPIYVLAWTTTPWTLPGNMALAVGKEIVYVLVRLRDVYYIVARERLDVLGEEGEAIKEIPGSALAGLSYEPIYDTPKVQEQANEKTWTIQVGYFVTTEEGTGVVHIAPMYGEDDYQLGKSQGLPMVQLLDSGGHYNDDAPEFVCGRYYKKGGEAIIADLENRGLIFTKHRYTHSYPHCYRCGTRLIYNAISSWFIDIQSVKDRLLEENANISWYPSHLKEGRFKYVLEHAPDWNISRNRYWASPLPIWKNEKTGAVTVFGSLEELKARTKKSGNTYLAVRHGESTYFAEGIYTIDPEGKYGLTTQGADDVRALAAQVPQGKPIRLFYSPVRRTKESAEILARELRVPDERVHMEPRLREIEFGTCEGKPKACFQDVMEQASSAWYTAKAEGGESNDDVRVRAAELLYELENTYTDETILLVTHEALVQALATAAEGLSNSSAPAHGEQMNVPPASLHDIPFVPLPHNANFTLDLHRPYIDELLLITDDGTPLSRVPEVVDCWVESGSMSIAAEHRFGEPIAKPVRYPGDFIAEYIAQTRTWFNYMHTMGVLLFNEHSFKNCVTTGTVLAEDGSKMSKSKGNFTDPMINIDTYGADALRLYLLGSVVMQAEDMSFRDEELREMHNRFISMLWNSYKFYTLYAGMRGEDSVKGNPPTILDSWIFARLHETVAAVSLHLDHYDTVHAVRVLQEFVTDLSTWYIRRSRDRFKEKNDSVRQTVLACSREIFLTLAKLLAPLAPFIAEDLYRGVGGSKESVHLEDWPEQDGVADENILTTMTRTREVVSHALELRSVANLKIRQPLAALTIPDGTEVYAALVMDEVNVKDIRYGSDFALDTTLTPELCEEGDIRELIRAVQDLRKRAGLNPGDTITLGIDTDDPGRVLIERFRKSLTETAGVADIVFAAQPEGEMVKGESWGLMRAAIV